jgi:alpha-2-macroglobulin
MARKTIVFSLSAVLVISIAAAIPPQIDVQAYQTLKAEAERLYAEKSFSRAHELYAKVDKAGLPGEEQRWVTMRLPDTGWRANPDEPEEERQALEKFVAEGLHDLAWAEANESLGDLFLHERRGRDIYNAVRFYGPALDYWAGSADIEVARRRYLAIVARMTDRAYYAGAIPREVLVNALSIAQTPEDRARFRFALASQLLSEGRPESIERGLEHLEAIIAEGKKSEWYDDALFTVAQRLAQPGGSIVVLANGQIEHRADYQRALEYYRRILREFKPEETRYYQQARSAIEVITRVDVAVMTGMTFVPDSEQEIAVSWRNTRSIELAITAVDLTSDPNYTRPQDDWVQNIRTAEKTPVRKWTFTTPDGGPYAPGTERIRLEPKLPPGAYIVTAGAQGESSRQLLLVTDAHIVAQTASDRLQVFVSDVVTGAPIANARVAVWQQTNQTVVKKTAQTNAEGLAVIEGRVQGGGDTVITAAAGSSRQAWTRMYRYWHVPDQAHWRIYAFTDRPAYRPNETVQWKIIARVRERDRWITPANQTLTYVITNPRAEKVKEGTITLNEFGSFWAELPLTADMPLGQYMIEFKQKEQVAGAQLFRLEEYKLPEFEVKVSTPEGKQYRLGETIEAQIEASYYFGGPVANATVEAVVFFNRVYRPWYPRREYAWYFPEPPEPYGGMQIKRETLTTDANGRAVLRIETSREGADALYRIEARVVDASRREVRGEGTVRVMRQRYSVQMRPEHNVHRPGEQVSIEIRALDANDQPVQTTGTVTVLRRTSRGDEEVMTGEVKTNARGEATFSFTPKREGFYVVRWRSEDRDPNAPLRARDIVNAETTVWVAERRTTDLGFPTSALDLVIDKESFRAGEKVTAVVITPSSGRWVVVTASADDILETQVVRLDGTVKLLEFSIDERHKPNFFLSAFSVFERNVSFDIERVVVPPVEHFLNVEVTSDRENYRPRDEAKVTITTRDHTGKPVPAEVALSVSDEAVTAIQQDLAGDPRPFFFGELRTQQPQFGTSVSNQRYVKLIERNGRLVDADAPPEKEEEAKMRRQRGERDLQDSFAVSESVAATAAPAPVAPPPPPAPAPQVGRLAAKEAAAADGAAMQVEVRSDFRSTAFWKPDIVTDAGGTATVTVKMPEALTTWRATARAATRGAEFGLGTDTSRTNLPLIVRLQAPRFFVAGDRTTVSAVLNNNTDQPLTVTPSIEVKGLTLRDAAHAAITVPAHAEARADWNVSADVAGPATIRVTGRGASHGDAMEKTFLVFEHGIDKLIARSGKTRTGEVTIRLDLPSARRATDLTVSVVPTLADSMIAALPYLLAFPYGCTEQTMSRFLPAAVVAKTGLATGVKNLDEITRAGMARLYDMQHEDGSWGWWKESPADDFMTAYVLWGFSIARDAGLSVRRDAVDRAAAYLQRRLVVHERDVHLQAWLLHALSAWRKSPTTAETRAFDNVWGKRDQLSAYSRALLALTAHRYGNTERANVLVRNLENGVKVDNAPDTSVLIGNTPSGQAIPTAYWGAGGFWWRWHEGPVETTAFVLQALVNIDPEHKLIEPAMNWLIKNRRGAQWSNTRDTAIAVLALNDYLKISGELKNDVAYEVTVNGKVAGTGSGSKTFSIEPSLLREAAQEIRIRRTSGTGPLYFAAEARFVSLEEPVKAAGNELFVRRDYYRLVPKPTLLKGVTYDKVLLRDGESIASGDRVEVVVSVEPKNDYSYLIFEDLKPAGLEAVSLQSGEPIWATDKKGRTAFVYQELRDRKVALFIDHLQQGIWEIRYTLRAEVPGTYHALPLLGQAMYVPDIRANGDEVRLTVR